MATGSWLTITELAAAKGVSKATISERVSRLEGQGRLVTRRDGKSKLVNLAEFDVAVGETTDLAKVQAIATRQQSAPPSLADALPADPSAPVYTREQARHMAYKADLAEIDLKRRRGEVIETGLVTEAMARCSGAIVKLLDQMPGRADDLAAAVARDGAMGARAALKALAYDMRLALTREMRLIETEAPPESPQAMEVGPAEQPDE